MQTLKKALDPSSFRIFLQQSIVPLKQVKKCQQIKLVISNVVDLKMICCVLIRNDSLRLRNLDPTLQLGNKFITENDRLQQSNFTAPYRKHVSTLKNN